MNTGSTPPVTSVTSFFAFLLPHNSVYPRPSAFFIIHYMATFTGDTGDGVYSCGSCRHQQLKTTGDTPFLLVSVVTFKRKMQINV